MKLHGKYRSSRAGQSLVEFAVVALVLYMLLAAIVTFGHSLYVAQGLQSAADLAAREISRTPLPPNANFEDVLDDGFLGEIYSDDFLVFDLDTLPEGGSFFTDVIPDWPIVNQQLATMMIVDRPDFDGDGTPDRNLIRYPGALLFSDESSTGLTVGIPLVTSRSDTGVETIRWVPVLEEIENDDNLDPFNIDNGGVVALRINCPVQSPAMSGFRPNADGPFEPTVGQPNLADDDGVIELNEAPGDLTEAPLQSGGILAGTYGGQYGLGAQGVMVQTVRPFRRVISAQAIYRREVFSAPE